MLFVLHKSDSFEFGHDILPALRQRVPILFRFE